MIETEPAAQEKEAELQAEGIDNIAAANVGGDEKDKGAEKLAKTAPEKTDSQDKVAAGEKTVDGVAAGNAAS